MQVQATTLVALHQAAAANAAAIQELCAAGMAELAGVHFLARAQARKAACMCQDSQCPACM